MTNPAAPGRGRRRLLFALVLALLATLGTGLVFTVPIGDGNDEHAYFKYIAFMSIEGRQADQSKERFTAAQHPPAYFALMASIYGFFRGDVESQPLVTDPQPFVFPYEKRIAPPLGEVQLDLYSGSARADTSPPTNANFPLDTLRVSGLYVLRLTGVLMLLLLAWIVFRVLARVFPDRPDTAALAAAASLLVPQLAGTFATVNNDQFSALFAAAGFGVVAVATHRGNAHDSRPLLLAALLFGIGFLSKLWILGGFAATAWLLAFHTPVSWSRRIRSVVLLGSGPLFIGGWWLVKRTLASGSPLGTELQVTTWPAFLRGVAPDVPFGYLREAARVIPSWLSKIGGRDLMPPTIWMTVAQAWPLLLVASVLACIVTRKASSRDRAIVWAFLAGTAVQFGALGIFSHRYAGAHGRYFQSLLLPGTAALVAGLPYLVGARARGVLASFVGLMAVGGLLLLHADALPMFGANHRWTRTPDVLRYVDFGAHEIPDATIAGGLNSYQPSWEIARPDQRGRITTSRDVPIRVILGGLDPRDLHLLSVRLLPYSNLVMAGIRSSVELRVGDRWIAGPLAIYAVDGWVSYPVPVDSPTLTVDVWNSEGAVGAISELVVRRLPLRFERAVPEAGGLRVSFTSDSRERLPPLLLNLRSPEGPESEPRQLRAGADQPLSVVLPLPRGGTVEALLVRVAPAPVIDVKLNGYMTPQGTGAFLPQASGFLGINATDTPPGITVAQLPAHWLPTGRSTLHILDGDGHDAGGAFTLDIPGEALLGSDKPGRRLEKNDQGWTLWLNKRTGQHRRLTVTTEEGAGQIDRLQVRQSMPWVIPLR
jgi:hypothetical protein